MVSVRLPNITAATESGQLSQLKDYIFQFAEQMNYALTSIDKKQSEVAASVSEMASASETPSPDNAATTFGEVKSLIIKSADIINAYYDEINKKLSGEYVACSDFGKYTEKTDATIRATSEKLEQEYYNKQTIDSEISTIYETLANAYIRSGLLENGDVPIYGLEVGQKNTVDGVEVFNKYARFTADRLSFYDKNGIEVAYISDYKLYITSAEITDELYLGGYKVDLSDGIAFKWNGV